MHLLSWTILEMGNDIQANVENKLGITRLQQLKQVFHFVYNGFFRSYLGSATRFFQKNISLKK